MSNQRIVESLSGLFASSCVVFWHDVDGEFTSQVQVIAIEGVEVLCIDQMPSLQTKLRIEADVEKKWLLYSTKQEPEPAKDWLLDVRLRSKQFRADSTSILLDELGLKK